MLPQGKKTEEWTVVLLGDVDVGKSAFATQLYERRFEKLHVDTIMETLKMNIEIEKQPCTIWMLDTSGAEYYAEARKDAIQQGHGFVLQYSITSRRSFEFVEEMHDLVLRLVTYSGTHGAPIILVGSKCDKHDDREVSKMEGIALAKKFECEFTESSATDYESVETAISKVVRALRRDQRGARGYLNQEAWPRKAVSWSRKAWCF